MSVFLFYIALLLGVLLAGGILCDLWLILVEGVHPWDFS